MTRRGNREGEEEEDDLFSRLPEGCISNILSFTSPRDSCSLSAVSRLFHSASKCEHIWDRFVRSGCSGFLPLEEKLQQVSFSSKKDLFFLLCDPTIINDGKLVFNDDDDDDDDDEECVCFAEYFIGQNDWQEVLYVVGERASYYIWKTTTELATNFSF
ncbi:putative F-box protein PP2-B12 [Cinnamomum micranthum f. kanehirae]|uniref:Putative F-box protein PP2-B12 n=1 Tax=Cinnamomum micranthum f. kanehirae TaxID=337451 RepID=A0A3S3NRR5_9MAGN|nr:putative F-box protein PP2-B12 [Cinnamomum micranthum f. kanehirae]